MDAAQQDHRIVEMPAWTAAGLWIDCPNFDASGIGELWQRFGAIAHSVTEHDGIFGISLPLPDGSMGMRYWAVMKCNAATPVPDGLESMQMPAKRFAVWPFYDHPSQMPAAFQDIFHKRLQAAGLESDPAWTSMEFYPPDWHDEAAQKFKCDLYVAIR